MNESLQSLKNQALELWKGLGSLQKWLLGGAVAALFLLLLLLAFGPKGSGYVPLFTQLEPRDAGEILAVLQEEGISYEVAGQGETILVSEEAVYETRLELASQGLPRGGVVGFELFNESTLGQTEFERRIRYNWALQGELTRTIAEIDGVQDARVHIALPEQSLFVSERRDPTASVMVEMAPGRSLASVQVQGIVNLMARSVEGLASDNVTVLDNRGNILSDSTDDGILSGKEVASRFDVERAYEQSIQRDLQAVLEQVYGRDEVVVSVSARLNFDVYQERSEFYEPVVRNDGIVRSEEHTSERSTTAPPAQGEPGVTANVPGYVAPDGDGEAYEREQSIVNYEINKTETYHESTPGRLDGLSVAVWVNDPELDDAERESISSTVVAALGLQPDRGDQVSVVGTSFETGVLEVAAPPAAAAAVAIAWWVYALAGLLVLLLVYIWWRRRAARLGQAVDLTVPAEGPEGPAATPEEMERRERVENLERMAKQQPKEFARLLKTWLVEE